METLLLVEETDTPVATTIAAVGSDVETPYGAGTVVRYRPEDAMYEVRLHNTHVTLFTKDIQMQSNNYESSTCSSSSSFKVQQHAMELNVAYGACEKMRRLNLEIKCFEAGLGQEIDHDQCTYCILSRQVKPSANRFPRLQKFVDEATTVATTAATAVAATTHSAIATTSSSLSSSSSSSMIAGASSASTGNNSTTATTATANSASRFPRLQKLVDNASALATPAASSATAASTTADTTTGSDATASTARFPRLKSLWGTASIAASAVTALANPTRPLSATPSTSTDHTNTSTANATVAPESSESTSVSVATAEDGNVANIHISSDKDTKVRAPAPTTQKSVVLPRIQKLLDDREKSSITPCLVCGSSSCPAHSSASFRKEGITLCQACERFFELSFIVECVSTPDAKKRAMHIDEMIGLYDRCLLLLRYSAQYIDTIAAMLEQTKEQQNKIGLGSSGAGVVSGVLGVAAAVTILTPVGPPLLIASLIFGGSATAVQTGSDAMNYFSEPNKLADRILSLHGMLHSLLRVTGTLRDAMMRDHIRIDAYAAKQESMSEHVQKTVEQNRVGVLAVSNVGRSITLGGLEWGGAVAGAEVSVVGARSATAFTRAGTAAARTMRFARFAGGALSAAVLVMEANAIKNTLKSIHAGNPCEKATAIRNIAKELEEGQLPTTASLDEECQAYLATMADRSYPPPESAMTSAMATAVPLESSLDVTSITGTEEDLPPLAVAVFHDGELLCAPGATIIEEDRTASPNVAVAVAASDDQQHPPPATGPPMGGSSLFERIQLHRRMQAQAQASATDIGAEVRDNSLRESDLNLLV